MDRAVAATLTYAGAGVALTCALHRRGHRQLCQVARSPTGFVCWVLFSLHLWSPRWDPVRRVSTLFGGH